MLKPSAAPQPFCVALSPSVHWNACFLYCYAFYTFCFLGFLQWRSRADRGLTMNMSILLPLFGSTWSRARGQDSVICAGLVHGRDYCYSIVDNVERTRASEQKSQKCLAFVFPWIVKNSWKTQGHARGFFNPYPPRWYWARQCTDTRAFYIDALSIIFFLDSSFVSGDLALTVRLTEL